MSAISCHLICWVGLGIWEFWLSCQGLIEASEGPQILLVSHQRTWELLCIVCTYVCALVSTILTWILRSKVDCTKTRQMSNPNLPSPQAFKLLRLVPIPSIILVTRQWYLKGANRVVDWDAEHLWENRGPSGACSIRSWICLSFLLMLAWCLVFVSLNPCWRGGSG